MKVFNNPHFTKQTSTSMHSLSGSRHSSMALTTSLLPRMTKSQTLKEVMDENDKQKENDDAFQSEVIRSPDIQQFQNDEFIQKLQRMSDKQETTIEEISKTDLPQPDLSSSRAQFNLVQEITALKDRVLDLLREYQTSLSNKNLDKKNAVTIRRKIKEDTENISRTYSNIVYNYKNFVCIDEHQIEKIIPSSQEEEEYNQMFNLIEEFLEKFNNQKAVMNAYSLLLREKIVNVGNDSSDDRTSPYDFGFNPYESSPLGIQNEITDMNYVNDRIQAIKSELFEQMTLDTLSSSRQLVQQTIEQLQDVQYSTEPKIINNIIQKIELTQSMDDPILQKLASSFEKAIQVCQAKKEEINNLKTLSQEQIQQAQRRRKFFDQGLKIKRSLPSYHPGKKLLISEIYEDSIEEHILEKDWGNWISQQFNNELQK